MTHRQPTESGPRLAGAELVPLWLSCPHVIWTWYQSRGPGRPEQGLVVPRSQLDSAVSRRAVEAGAELWQGCTVTGHCLSQGRVSGIRLLLNGKERSLDCRFTVAADGASSAFASRVGLRRRDRWGTGCAIRGYYTGAAEVDDLFCVYVPLADETGSRNLPGYGWVFPLGPGTVNLGVGFFPSQSRDFDVNLRRVFDGFLRELRKNDRRFTRLRQIGPLRGGKLPCDMFPDQCAGKGVVLVGDAAGLVDPFTGEGINTALESGKLAAQILADALTASNPEEFDLSVYGRTLEERYRDRIQLGSRFIRSYGFIWKLLEHTLDLEQPLFCSLRKALVDYGVEEAPGASPHQFGGSHLALPRGLGIDTHVRKIRQLLGEVVQPEFPLLSRVSLQMLDPAACFMRSALACLCGKFGLQRQPAQLVTASTAVEMAHLAFALHSEVLPSDRGRRGNPSTPRPRGTNWGNMFAITAGNFMLAKAHALLSELGSELCLAVSRASAEVCLGRLMEIESAGDSDLPADRRLKILEKKRAPFFELPCRLAAMLSQAPPRTVESLAAYGRLLGVAFEVSQAMPGPDCIEQGGGAVNGQDTIDSLAWRAAESLRELPTVPARHGLEVLAELVRQRALVAPAAGVLKSAPRRLVESWEWSPTAAPVD